MSDDEQLKLLDGDIDIEHGFDGGYNVEPIVDGAVPRLGVPGIRFTDVPRGVVMGRSTCFPVAMAGAATWDVELEMEGWSSDRRTDRSTALTDVREPVGTRRL
jgi:beta-glucosidase